MTSQSVVDTLYIDCGRLNQCVIDLALGSKVADSTIFTIGLSLFYIVPHQASSHTGSTQLHFQMAYALGWGWGYAFPTSF